MIFQNYFLLLDHAQLMIFSLLWFEIFLLVIFQITIVKGVTVAKLQYFKFSVICLTKRLNAKTTLMSNQLMMQQRLHVQLMWKSHMTLLCQKLLLGVLDLKDRIWFGGKNDCLLKWFDLIPTKQRKIVPFQHVMRNLPF